MTLNGYSAAAAAAAAAAKVSQKLVYYSTVVSFTTALYHSRYASRARLGCQRHVIACDRDRTDR